MVSLTARPVRAARGVPLPLPAAGLLAAVAATGALMPAAPAARADGGPPAYRPRLASPEVVAPFLKDVEPGHDAFPEERDVAELQVVLRELAGRMKTGDHAAAVRELLAPAFRGGRLRPPEPAPAAREGALEVRRAHTLPPDLVLDAAAFAAEWRRLVDGIRQVTVAEFLVTAIAVERDKGLATTDVRYDIVGAGTAGLAGRARGRLADDVAADAVGLAGRRVDGHLTPGSRAAGAGLHRGHRGRPRGERLVPPPARRRPGRVGRDPRLRAHPRLERPPRRLGGGCGRRRPGGPLRRAARGAAQPPLPGPRRRHVRGRHGARRPRPCWTTPRSRSSPTWTTTATRTSSSPPAPGRCSS